MCGVVTVSYTHLDVYKRQGSTAVTVEIEEGGISLIRITDNGCGIAKQDVENAFLRHSTSKIRSAEDLTHLSSLGFRGEALSSISAVARVEPVSYTHLDVYKRQAYVYCGGEINFIDVFGIFRCFYHSVRSH